MNTMQPIRIQYSLSYVLKKEDIGKQFQNMLPDSDIAKSLKVE